MKRLCSIVLIIMLVMATGMPAAAAEKSATAVTMRLEKTEGTVSLTNKNGKAVSISNGMKIYSGYTVSTKASSYAYLSLDNTKAAKLDASSSAEIRKSGKKLKVLLKSGNIFFNVSKPVKTDESLEVRTSTMVTGIRGTSGIIKVVDDETSVLYLLDGKVNMISEDAAGNKSEVAVKAGEMAVATRDTDANGQNAVAVTVDPYSPTDIAGFAAVEIAKDEQLKERVAKETKWDVSHVVDSAQDTLKKDEEKAKETSAKQEAVKEKKVFAAGGSSSGNSGHHGSGGGSGNGSNDSTNTPDEPDGVEPPDEPDEPDVPDTPDNPDDPEEPDDPDNPDDSGDDDEPDSIPTGEAITLQAPTAKQIKEALARYQIVKIENMSALTGEAIVVKKGKLLSVESGQMVLQQSAPLTIKGNLIVQNQATLKIASEAQLKNEGMLTIRGMLEIAGRFENKHTVWTDREIRNAGYLKNEGRIICGSETAVQNSGIIECDGCYFQATSEQVIQGSGLIQDKDELPLVLQKIASDNQYIWFDQLSEVIDYMDTEIRLTLLEDLTELSDLEVPKGQKVSFNLAGHNLTMQGKSFTNKGELTIIDEATVISEIKNDQQTGKISLGKGTLKNSGNLTLRNITLTANSDVTLENKGSLQLENSTVRNSAAGCALYNEEDQKAAAVMDGGVLSSQEGVPLIVEEQGTVLVKDGTIESLVERAIVVYGNGLTLAGGQIKSWSINPSRPVIDNEQASVLWQGGEIVALEDGCDFWANKRNIHYPVYVCGEDTAMITVVEERVMEDTPQKVAYCMAIDPMQNGWQGKITENAQLYFGGKLTIDQPLKVKVVQGITLGNMIPALIIDQDVTLGSGVGVTITDQGSINNVKIENKGSGITLRYNGQDYFGDVEY